MQVSGTRERYTAQLSLYFPLRLTRSPLGKVAGKVAFYSHFPDRKSVPTSAEKFRSGPATRRQTSFPSRGDKTQTDTAECAAALPSLGIIYGC